MITPTIFRPQLEITCQSIDKQLCDCLEIEHIIIHDGPKQPEFEELEKAFNSDHRKIYYTKERYGKYGDGPRKEAWQYATGDYILYIDDDDWYINNTFKVIQDHLELTDNKPIWGVFPAQRMGETFFNLPPAASMTVSCQHFHMRIDPDGNPITWVDGDYGVDGEWLEGMKQKYPDYMVIEGKPLVRVDYISRGEKEI